jgi:hypothetical protein
LGTSCLASRGCPELAGPGRRYGDRAQPRAGLGDAFLVLASGYRVGDDASASLEVDLVRLDDQ